VLWPDPLIVPGRASMLTELIDVAGGISITAGDGDAYPRFSLEAAVARAPEVIILADHSTGSSTAGRPAPEQWQRLSSVPAIRAGRLHSADLSILHRYGPRVPDGLEMLARIIHPEAFR
jgi:iron complex transport system substrate-binding protein